MELLFSRIERNGAALRRICGLLAAVIVMLTAGLGTAESDTDREIPKFRDVSVHDPSVIRADDGLYYIFGSHMAAARSAAAKTMFLLEILTES